MCPSSAANTSPQADSQLTQSLSPESSLSIVLEVKSNSPQGFKDALAALIKSEHGDEYTTCEQCVDRARSRAGNDATLNEGPLVADINPTDNALLETGKRHATDHTERAAKNGSGRQLRKRNIHASDLTEVDGVQQRWKRRKQLPRPLPGVSTGGKAPRIPKEKGNKDMYITKIELVENQEGEESAEVKVLQCKHNKSRKRYTWSEGQKGTRQGLTTVESRNISSITAVPFNSDGVPHWDAPNHHRFVFIGVQGFLTCCLGDTDLEVAVKRVENIANGGHEPRFHPTVSWNYLVK